MLNELSVKFTTPSPELLALKVPLKVDVKLSLPAAGTDCVIVRVKVPEALIGPLPLKNVWKLPKLEPVGVFRLVDPRPVNVSMSALPMPPRKVTEFEPLPAHPTQVKMPDVEKVTGSAATAEAPSATRSTNAAITSVDLAAPGMTTPLLTPLGRITRRWWNGSLASEHMVHHQLDP
jgi:hypothetical protein